MNTTELLDELRQVLPARPAIAHFAGQLANITEATHDNHHVWLISETNRDPITMRELQRQLQDAPNLPVWCVLPYEDTTPQAEVFRIDPIERWLTCR